MSTDKPKCKIGPAIAFTALCTAAVILEVNGREASGLWIVVVIWAFCF